MGKLYKFPNRKREVSREEAQRRWLAQNAITVVAPWKWPESTWLQKRLDEVRTKNCKVK
jgi:hypothetical protein